MAFLNAATSVLHLNVAYYGPALSGKSTTLEAVHGRFDPGARSEMGWAMEPFRLLACYVEPLSLGGAAGASRLCFHLSAIPGFHFESGPRELLLRNVDAVIFVADAQTARFEANLEMRENLREQLAAQGRVEVPTVLQYNKVDLPDAAATEELDAALNPEGLPRFESIALEGAGVMEPFKKACVLMLTGLRDGRVRTSDMLLLKTPPEPVRLWSLFRSDLVDPGVR